MTVWTQCDYTGQPYTPTGRPDVENLWDSGGLLYPYEPKEPTWLAKDPAEMTYQELVETQYKELPSISKISWSLGLEGTLSLDMPSSSNDDGEGNTLGELVSLQEIASKFQTTKPISEFTNEELAAYEQFMAEKASYRHHMVPYIERNPDLESRQQWERQRYYSSDPIRMRMKGGTVQIVGAGTLDEPTFTKLARSYLKRVLKNLGEIPDADRIQAAKETITTIRRSMSVEMEPLWYEVNYLGDYFIEAEVERSTFLDLDLHGGHEEILELDEEEEAMEAMGFTVEREIQIRGMRKRATTPEQLERSLWHGTLSQQATIGYHDKPEDYREDEDTIQLPFDKTGLTALATLLD
jgi:hypothetical protein